MNVSAVIVSHRSPVNQPANHLNPPLLPNDTRARFVHAPTQLVKAGSEINNM